jgi:hypothetical protein
MVESATVVNEGTIVDVPIAVMDFLRFVRAATCECCHKTHQQDFDDDSHFLELHFTLDGNRFTN